MKSLLKSLAIMAACFAFTPAVHAESIDPATTEFPWMNGPARDSRFAFAVNKVHVFEAYSLSCSYCNTNASAVKAMAAEYADNERIQFLDLGLDTSDRDYASWISRHQPTYPVVKDVNRRVWNALNQTNGIPQTFVVNCRGELVGYTVGAWGSAEKRTLRNAIARAEETVCE
jgi:hypothetical protein